jgi:hypothetical protein
MEVPTNIPQKPLVGNEKTVPELSDIRKLLGKLIPTADVTDKDIKFWLQAPTSSKETKSKDGPGKADNDCEQRATALASTLKPSSAKYQPRLFNTDKFSTLAVQWEGVDRTLAAGTPVIIKGLDTFVGGETSKFKSEKSHHVVLFLAAGKESGVDFYVGYDPDISATEETNTAWKIADAAETNNKIISDLVLGTGDDGLGPLCRKYYVDKTRLFPLIKRLEL